MSDYKPLCNVQGIGTIYTTKSFWDWYNKEPTEGQLSKLRYYVYNYTIAVTIPKICGDTSTKLTDIENAIKEGKIKKRKNRNGHIELECNTYRFIPMGEERETAAR